MCVVDKLTHSYIPNLQLRKFSLECSMPVGSMYYHVFLGLTLSKSLKLLRQGEGGGSVFVTTNVTTRVLSHAGTRKEVVVRRLDIKENAPEFLWCMADLLNSPKPLGDTCPRIVTFPEQVRVMPRLLLLLHILQTLCFPYGNQSNFLSQRYWDPL